jgi:glycerophosphoryl diester phosphodiesterase
VTIVLDALELYRRLRLRVFPRVGRALSACARRVDPALSFIMVAGLHAGAAAKKLVAHRGACAYAPEHTLASYRLALQQGADYVEQDLAVTKDHVLICLHDDSLERTTNVADVFPDRAVIDPTGRKQWLAVDFTLAEVKQLDAGAWFDARFSGERIPTWEDAVVAVGGSAGLYPELKTPALYAARGIDQTALFLESITRLGLHTKPAGTLIVQSFERQPLEDVTREFASLGRTFLVEVLDGPRWLSAAGLAEAARFATGIAPDKALLDGRPELVQAAHAAGLTITPWTFSTRGHRGFGRFGSVTDEMRYYLYELDVDAVFTDNPDRFPR